MSAIKAFKNKGCVCVCVCSTKVLWERIFSLLKRWRNPKIKPGAVHFEIGRFLPITSMCQPEVLQAMPLKKIPLLPK